MGRGSRNWRNGTACIGRLSHHCFGVSESYRQVGLNAGQVAEACRLYAEGWSLALTASETADDVTDMTTVCGEICFSLAWSCGRRMSNGDQS